MAAVLPVRGEGETGEVDGDIMAMRGGEEGFQVAEKALIGLTGAAFDELREDIFCMRRGTG